jgi:membrane carboxypeptidase/penicillin-binding protein
VKLLQEVGVDRTVQYAKDLGVGDVPSVPSLALGSGEVTLQSLTAAYAAFANRGMVPQPLVIRRVEDLNGQVLYAPPSSATPAVSERTAFLLATMLADVIDAGTGNRARRDGFMLPAAGKTGTTNDFNDAWFVGFTPKLVAGVWVGFDQPHTILPNGFASEVAVPIWASFMKTATAGDKREWLRPPPGIVTATVCRMSGKLATHGCEKAELVGDRARIERSMVYTEYFAKGTEPTTSCLLHGSRGFFGAVASIFTGRDRPVQQIHVESGEADAPPPAVAAAPPAPPRAEPSEPQPKKRGFWGRIFGRDKNKKGQNQ